MINGMRYKKAKQIKNDTLVNKGPDFLRSQIEYKNQI